MTTSSIPNLRLNNAVPMPALGFGVFQTPPDENVGNDRARQIDVVTQFLPFVGYPRPLDALAAIDEVAPAAAGS